MLCLRLEGWQKAGLVRPMDARTFSHAFIHALHSMAMVEVLSGDTKSPSRPEELHAFVDLFWQGLKAVEKKAARRKTSRG